MNDDLRLIIGAYLKEGDGDDHNSLDIYIYIFNAPIYYNI